MRELLTNDTSLYLVTIEDTARKQYWELALGTIFIWDWVTRLDDEIDLIWMWDWFSLGKPVYLVLRYGGILAQMYELTTILGIWDTKYCTVYRYAMAMATALFLFLVDIVLAYRAACLYPNQFRPLSIINTVLLTCFALISAVLLALNVAASGSAGSPRYLTGCWSTRIAFSWYVMGPPLAVELWLFSLVVYKIYLVCAEGDLMRTKSMFRLVVKDQIYWFFLFTAIIAWGAIQFALARPTLRSIPFLCLRCFATTCGCHLILHVRRSYSVKREYEGITLTSVLFRKPTLNLNGTAAATQDLELEVLDSTT